MAKEVWADERDDAGRKGSTPKTRWLYRGAPSNDASVSTLSGKSYSRSLSTEQVGIYNVTFEPGCRK